MKIISITVTRRSAVLCMGTMGSWSVVPWANEPHTNLCMLYTAWFVMLKHWFCWKYQYKKYMSNFIEHLVLLAHLAKGHVSFCHHLASVVRRRPSVVRRKLFKKSSPLKLLDQLKPNLVWIITRVSSFEIVSGEAVHQPTWLLLLKTEHMVKLQVFWVITQKPLIISEIWHEVKMIYLQFWSKSDYPFWSYCPFLINFLKC